MLLNAVIVSVVVMTVLSLLRINVVLAILLAAISAGLTAGIPLTDTINLLVDGMGGQANTALSYILLGTFAVMIGYSGITGVLVRHMLSFLKGKKGFLLLSITAVACLSQNLIPVHIAFIPILIPPLLHLFDQMKLDRRAVATGLTFGLKAPYILIPAGYGLIFQTIIIDEMTANGMDVQLSQVLPAMALPVAGMLVGLLVAFFLTYRKDRELVGTADKPPSPAAEPQENGSFHIRHAITIVAIISALVAQLMSDSLIIGALTGIALMIVFHVVPFKKIDRLVNDGIAMMGMIAFVMLISSGYANILTESGAVEELVDSTVGIIGDSQVIAVLIMLFIGLVITMGIGSSFGTIPILAALFVPLSAAMDMSILATIALVGTSAALGDAGSPASDSTLGPTAGLNADGQHNHIWDTCVPTFLHFNIPLILFGMIAALTL
ncbi:Na+/H+ antiporter family protein [Shouchella shacheensis]|uniref:Na+/H+ antiporter family protein n=1 Tax=Shouchella shacheensis TaxID=1649580 RepID=UPI00073FFCD3|nr:Na+/H+ antiporter NhaC family protein [Shouchella shacheensis]